MEDIEDIYLFGTMITGLLLIGLGFALGYRRIQKTGTAVQSLTRLPVMIEAVGRAVSIETETINYIYITFSHLADAFIQSDLQLGST